MLITNSQYYANYKYKNDANKIIITFMEDLNQLNKTDIYFIIIKNFNTIYLRCYVEIKEERDKI